MNKNPKCVCPNLPCPIHGYCQMCIAASIKIKALSVWQQDALPYGAVHTPSFLLCRIFDVVIPFYSFSPHFFSDFNILPNHNHRTCCVAAQRRWSSLYKKQTSALLWVSAFILQVHPTKTGQPLFFCRFHWQRREHGKNMPLSALKNNCVFVKYVLRHTA